MYVATLLPKMCLIVGSSHKLKSSDQLQLLYSPSPEPVRLLFPFHGYVDIALCLKSWRTTRLPREHALQLQAIASLASTTDRSVVRG